MNQKFICISDEKPAFDFKNHEIGTTPKRALCFAPMVGRTRIYRKYLDGLNRAFKIKEFARLKAAQDLCDLINAAYNEDFKVEALKEN